jgi:hypothetical protein
MPESLDELIKIHKEKYGKVFSVPINAKVECVFRPLTVHEYERIEGDNTLSTTEVEDRIVSTCVFWPLNFNINDLQAGIITSLSEEILESSSFSDARVAQQALMSSRSKANTITSIMKTAVLALKDTIGYTLDDLNSMTFEQLCDAVTLAEQIIKIKKTIYDPSVELEISFGIEEEAESVPSEDLTALKLQQALYGG